MVPRRTWSAKAIFSSLVRLIGSRGDRRPFRTRLLAEALEDRTAPATFANIDPTLADGAPGSLRADINTANGNTDTMEVFTLNPGTFTVSGPGDLQLTGAGKTYLFEPASPGGGAVTIDAASTHRVFEVLPSVSVTFEGLTITGGLATDGGSLGGTAALGGGILNNNGNVTLQNVTLTGNKAQGGAGVNGTNPVSFGTPGQDAQGGGLYSTGGVLQITGSQIQGNMAIGGAGAMGGAGASSAPGGMGGAGQGGGLYATGGTLDITDSSAIASNQALGGAGGPGGNAVNPIILHQAGGVGGDGQGGGVFVTGVAVTITGNAISSNTAQGGVGGKGFDHTHTSGSGGAGGSGGISQGGGLYASGGSLAISSGTAFSGNQATGGLGGAGGQGSQFNPGGAGGAGGDAQGAGLYLTDNALSSSTLTATLSNATLSGNMATGGKGMNGGHGGGTESGRSGGEGGAGGAAQGGGLYTSASMLTISDSTVGGTNQALGGSGGQGGAGGNASVSAAGSGGHGGRGGSGQGGGVYAAVGVLDVVSSTIANDQAVGGQGGAGGMGGSNRPSQQGPLVAGAGGLGGTGGDGQGGGLFAESGTTSVSDSTVSTNTATGGNGGAGGIGGTGSGGTGGVGGNGGNGGASQGGGVFASLAAVTLGNTTIALNSAGASTGGGGGAGGSGGTVAANPSGSAGMAGTGQGGQGGGVANSPPSASGQAIDLESTLIATNAVTGPSAVGPDVFGAFTSVSFHDLIGIGDGSSGLTDTRTTTVPSDPTYEQVGTSSNPIVPLLGPLANNGGPTQTQALLFGSPAIDSGANPDNLANDQRGPGFFRTAGPQTDVGAYEVQVANLSGFVYIDSNDNGMFDSGESGIPNVTVTLTGTNEFGAIVNTSVTTGSGGAYTFANIYASNASGYTITETPPAGFLNGTNSVGSLGGTVGVHSFSGVVLNENADGVNYDFAHLQPASLSGFVYLDTNNDGIKGPGEAGILNVTVTLTGVSDQGQITPIPTTTDVNGLYTFANLRPGTYTITETPPSGFAQGKDTIGTPGGVTGSHLFSDIVLNSGVAGANNNFAELHLSSLSGFVYLDTSTGGFNDGIKQAGEQGVAGVNVYLIGSNSQGSVSTFTTTNADGSYTFGNLLPGAYAIIKGPTPNLMDGKDAVGSQGGRMIQNEIYNIGLAEGVNGVNNNFGELLSLSGYVYLDISPTGFNDGIKQADEQGLAGVYVYLIGSNEQGAVNTFTVTNQNGFYSFNNLSPGAYAVIKGPTTQLLDGKDALGSQGGKAIQNEFYNIGLNANVNAANNNFGELLPNSLSGYVYLDTDPTDGIKEASEQGLAGVTVLLIGANDQGAVSLSTVTDANGFYSFGGLRPGAYAIIKGGTPDFVDGKDTIGSQGGNTIQDEFFNIGLTSGFQGINNNFGLDGLLASLFSKSGFLASSS